MHSTVWTILVAAVTAVVVSIANGLIVTPRMEARKKRLGEAHAARDAFNSNMTTVLSACVLLRTLVPPLADNDPETTPVMHERLTGERERWLQQLDDATRWMIDNSVAYAGSWPGSQLKEFAMSYAASARMVVLSERSETDKTEFLLALTAPVRRQYFGFAWSRVRHYLADRRAFADTLARLGREATAT
ncbi:hypothetical protein [Streptomyces sp. MBT27]|uniref:hypothetical protein n=1 Tax=Streptomyces sp. MBT27 TaxID=1488356 RepID=UPI00141EB056|nr:hypothetical protein [Streptomyces sp. MBT27]